MPLYVRSYREEKDFRGLINASFPQQLQQSPDAYALVTVFRP
jgi:hypothetical protein